MKVLVTRPEADCADTARALAARGHEALCAPLAAVRPVSAALPPGPFGAVAFTSANAVRMLAALPGAEALRDLPVFAVGARTAEAAGEAGFTDVSAAAGDVASLAGLIVARHAPRAGAVLHLSGRAVAGDLVAALRSGGIAAGRLVVYEAVPADRLPGALADALSAGVLDAALSYSPRSARILVDLVARAGLATHLRRLPVACLSQAVAEPLRAAGVEEISVAAQPEAEALLDALDAMARRGAGLATGSAKRV